MKKKMFKALSIVLSLAMLLTTLFVVPVVSAEETKLMAHIQSTESEKFGINNLGYTGAATYTFKFSVSNDVDVRVFAGGYNSDWEFDSTAIFNSITTTLKSLEKRNGYTTYEYEVVTPDYDDADMDLADCETFALSVRATSGKVNDFYVFDMSLTDSNGDAAFDNNNFANGNLGSYFWGNTELSGTSATPTGTTIELVNFDITVLSAITKMAHIYNTSVSNVYGSYINYLPNTTYVITYTLSNNVTAVPGMLDNEWRDNVIATTDRLVSTVVSEGYTTYTYEVTTPSTNNPSGSGLALLGIKPTSAAPYDFYLFDISAYRKDDDTKAEVFYRNPRFSDGNLNGWTCNWANFSGTSGVFYEKGDSNPITVDLLDFNELYFTNDPRMVHLTGNQNAGAFISRIATKTGETYTFEFGIDNKSAFSVFVGDADNRKEITDATIARKSKTNMGKYSLYAYDVTIPSSYTKTSAFLGIKLKNTADAYVFDFSAYKASDTTKKELFDNPDFKNDGLAKWEIGEKCSSLSGFSDSYTDWLNRTLYAELEAFNESKFSYLMAHVTGTFDGAFAGKLSSYTAGETYTFEFAIDSVTSFTIGAFQKTGKPITNSTSAQISKNNLGKFTLYTYEITIPSDYTSDAYFGLKFPGSTDGYVFGYSVYKSDDTSKTELLTNPGFSSGNLSSYIIGENYGGQGDAITGEYDASWMAPDCKLVATLEEFDVSKFPITNMVHFYNTNSGGPFTNLVTAPAVGDTITYKFSISNNATFNVVATDEGNPNSRIAESVIFVSGNDCGRYTEYEYKVKVADSYANKRISLGLEFTNAKPCDLYVIEASAYHTSDLSRTNHFTNGNFADGTLNGWRMKYNRTISAYSKLENTYDNTNDGSKDQWGKSFSFEVVEFNPNVMQDVSALMPDGKTKAVHIESTHGGAFGQYVTASLGEKLTLKFRISNNVEFLVISNTDVKASLKNQTDYGKYADYEYEVAVTSDSAQYTGTTLFLGIGLKESIKYDCYVTNYSVINSAGTVVSVNGDFAAASLNGWHWNKVKLPGERSANINGDNDEYGEKDVKLTVGYFDENLLTEVRAPYIDKQDRTMIKLTEATVQGKEGTAGLEIKPGALEAYQSYTISFKYKNSSGSIGETLNFGVSGYVNGTDYNWGRIVSGTDSRKDDGKNITFTFTPTTANLVYDHYYVSFGWNAQTTIKTEMYISDLTLYKTSDSSRTNLLLSGNTETSTNHWWGDYGKKAQSNNFYVQRGSMTVEYMSYKSEYFDLPTDYHYGDADLNGRLNLLDLINTDSALDYYKQSGYMETGNLDVNADGSFNNSDITAVKQYFLGINDFDWIYRGLGLQTFQSGGAGSDAAAAALKAKIDSVTANYSGYNGTTYYVAENGSGSGTSSGNPMGVSGVQNMNFSAGDKVLFKCGDTFRITRSSGILAVPGVYYGSYGDTSKGKPILTGSAKNYADSSLWHTEDNRYWWTAVSADVLGSLVFNDGAAAGVYKISKETLTANGDYYIDLANNKLWLYMNQVNPGAHFDSIEISTIEFVFATNSSNSEVKSNIRIENLDIRYAARHGIRIVSGKNVVIRGCDLSWIGGHEVNGTGACTDIHKLGRLGNGIELWNSLDGATVEYNSFYQIFDAAITYQGHETITFKNLNASNNLIEYSSMNFEFWNNPGMVTANITVDSNIFRYGGCGIGKQRNISHSQENQAYILAWNDVGGSMSNFKITNNTFDVANCHYFYIPDSTNSNITYSGNKYYQSLDYVKSTVIKGDSAQIKDPDYANNQIILYQGGYSYNLDHFREKILIKDPTTTEVYWLD